MKIFAMLRLLVVPAVGVLLSACQSAPGPGSSRLRIEEIPSPTPAEKRASEARVAKIPHLWRDKADVLKNQRKPGGAFVNAKLRVSARPSYPPEMREKRISGKVWASFLIDKQGHVSEVRILESTNAGFNPMAIACCRAMLWEPARYQGRPVEVIKIKPISFHLID